MRYIMYSSLSLLLTIFEWCVRLFCSFPVRCCVVCDLSWHVATAARERRRMIRAMTSVRALSCIKGSYQLTRLKALSCTSSSYRLTGARCRGSPYRLARSQPASRDCALCTVQHRGGLYCSVIMSAVAKQGKTATWWKMCTRSWYRSYLIIIGQDMRHYCYQEAEH